jgi:GNAT superfamily N-acetyltransferase
VNGAPARLRSASSGDCDAVLRLWAHLFDVADPQDEPWHEPARSWFLAQVADPASARVVVVEVGGEVVATATGTLEVGVPNPHCVRGRTVRLANVFTTAAHRGRGHATALVRDVVAWARSVDADRVDLSTTATGMRIYEAVGFEPTTAPRMKLVL